MLISTWRRGRALSALFAALALSLIGPAIAPTTAMAGPLKLAVLKFGTVNWELDVIKTHKLDTAEGVQLEILLLASKNATAVALQADSADMIVTDWVWVTRQRSNGKRGA